MRVRRFGNESLVDSFVARIGINEIKLSFGIKNVKLYSTPMMRRLLRRRRRGSKWLRR